MNSDLIARASLSSREIELIILVGVALILIVSNRIRADLVAIVILVTLGLSRLITPEQAMNGLSSPAVMTIVGLFVITATLERTGVIQWIADRLARLSGPPEESHETRMIAVFMITGALLSLIMNNIAAGAVLLPAAVSVARRAEVPTSKILMPLAFGTLLGGMSTLFTTANIIVSGALQSQGQRPLTMLDFLPIGGAIAVTGTLYMLYIGRRFLPVRESVGRAVMRRTDLAETYHLAERMWEVRVEPGSPLAAQTLAESMIGTNLGLTVVGIWHGTEARIPPAASDIIEENDILLVLGREERVRQLELLDTTIGRDGRYPISGPELAVRLTEVVIGPRSPAIGRTLKESKFRSKYGLTTVAVWRAGRAYRTDIGDLTMQAGDALLMVGSAEKIRAMASEPGYILIDEPSPGPALSHRRAVTSVLITLAVIALSSTGVLPTAEAMLAGGALMVLTGCISMDQAYRSIEWRLVALIGGMLPIGAAMVATGLAAHVGRAFTVAFAGVSPAVFVLGFFLLTAAFSQFIGGQVSALIIGPIAVSAAVNIGINPTAVGVAVSIACSAAFVTPIAHPVNVLMMGPGGYEFKDFFRPGIGLLAVCSITLLLMMPLLLRL